MSMLIDSQIDFITNEINGYEKLSRELKDDLIDHFCCAIEDEMAKGNDFDTAYRFVYEKVCPGGLNELTEEASFIPTSVKRKRLNRMLKVSGTISLTGATFTVLLKLFHLPFGQIALLLTAAVSIFIFFPALFFHFFQTRMGIRQIGKFPYIVGCIGTILLISSVTFYTSHWPGTAIALLSAVLCVDFAFFPLIFTKLHKKNGQEAV